MAFHTFSTWTLQILNSKHWDGYREELSEEGLKTISQMIFHRLQDFIAITYFNTSSFRELHATDEGMIKLASVFKDVLTDPAVNARYQSALKHGDDGFLVPFQEALKRPERKLHGASEAMLDPRYVLFMNWEAPLLYPRLAEPLSEYTAKQLSELLDPIVTWNEERIRKEIHLLNLSRKRKT